MNEQTFFADVNLPFHVWVRDGSASKGFRWVLKDRRDAHDDAGRDPASSNASGRSPASQ